MQKIQHFFVYGLLLMMVATFSGCAVVGGIFKAGVWVGVLAVVAILGVIILIISKSSKK